MLPAIFGISGYKLTAEEAALFRDRPPCGFILFRRNIDTPEQTRELVESLRSLTGKATMPILIDQEGGRVQRLRPPHWADLPNLRALGDLYRRDAEPGIKATKLHTQTIAGMLLELGINLVCAPVLDVPVKGAHDVIGNRAFAEEAEIVAELGTIMVQEFIECGIVPIIKHIPGHGRADVDSHYECPVVSAGKDILKNTDFLPFKQVSEQIGATKMWAMTAHVIFKSIDDLPVSVSPAAIKFIREVIGFNGVLIPDAIEMEALGGTSLAHRAITTLNAGCDVIMHCTGKIDEIRRILDVLPPISAQSLWRFEHSLTHKPVRQVNWRETLAELEAMLPIEEAGAYKAHEALTTA